jgi:hypothetical protein
MLLMLKLHPTCSPGFVCAPGPIGRPILPEADFGGVPESQGHFYIGRSRVDESVCGLQLSGVFLVRAKSTGQEVERIFLNSCSRPHSTRDHTTALIPDYGQG